MFFLALFLIGIKWTILYTDTLAQEKIGLTPKMLREVKIMENRHFKSRTDNGESESYRLERLEIELMGRSFTGLPLDERMKTLKIASQKRMLSGTSLPPSVAKYYSPKRINNDLIQVVPKNDDVGIIDGLMKVYAPDLFRAYRARKDRQFELFDD